MIATLQKVLEGVLDRLYLHVTTYLPPLLAAFILMLGAFLAALSTRWVIYRIFKGLTMDRFLRQSGVAFMIDRSGRLRATRIVAETSYWAILIAGLLTGLSVFNTDLTTQIVQSFVFLLPKVVVAGLIMLAGAWLAQFLGRSALVWAVNEGFPWPRRLASAVRIVIFFVAITVAADQLNFARGIFLSAFVILVGGAMLAVSLAAGIAGGIELRRFWQRAREEVPSREERSLWHHL